MWGSCFASSQMQLLTYNIARAAEVQIYKLFKIRVRIFVYLDDMIILGDNNSSFKQSVKWFHDSIKRCGIIVNQKKSILEPVESINWLGFELTSGRLAILKDTISKRRL